MPAKDVCKLAPCRDEGSGRKVERGYYPVNLSQFIYREIRIVCPLAPGTLAEINDE